MVSFCLKSLVVVAAVVLAASPSPAQKVPCTKVLRVLQDVERAGSGRAADSGRVAATLGTSAAWVEKCAATYGRRVRPSDTARRQREIQEPIWESQEFEAVAREDRQTAGDVLVDPPPYRDKLRTREFSRSDQEWEPYEKSAWGPSTGRQWSPYLVDPHRTTLDDVPGLIDD